jgi:hypothetical protein
VESYRKPATGEPIKAANPLNKINNPKAFVNFSRPSRSTRIIEVKEM